MPARSILPLLLALVPACCLHLSGIKELISHYDEIFPHGNRNAASHRWSTFVLDNAQDHTQAEIELLFQGFCPVSGSPLGSTPAAYNRFEILLSALGGGQLTGATHHCCWPCLCDLHDFVRVDTKTVQAADGARERHFLVIGDPCSHPEALTEPYKGAFGGQSTTIAEGAPDVTCGADGKLEKATYSDRGGVIIGLLLDPEAASDGLARKAYRAWTYGSGGAGPQGKPSKTNTMEAMAPQCAQRAALGFNSGMGAIFRKVAEIQPLRMMRAGGEDEVDCASAAKALPPAVRRLAAADASVGAGSAAHEEERARAIAAAAHAADEFDAAEVDGAKCIDRLACQGLDRIGKDN